MAITYDGATDSDHTSELSPGGLFTHPSDVATIDITTVEGHLNDAVNAARNSEGWAVGSTTEPLDGWSATNNSKYYSEQASREASDADQAAARAEAQANIAQTQADRATSQAGQAATSATAAAGSATAAADSATAAAASATAAAQSEVNAEAAAVTATSQAQQARDAATEARADAMATDSDARAVELDLAEIRRLHQEIASDSEEIARLSVEIAIDSEEIAARVARFEEILLETASDSEEAFRNKELARAFAEGRGSESGNGYGYLRETRGVITVSNATRSGDFIRLEVPPYNGVVFPPTSLPGFSFQPQNLTGFISNTLFDTVIIELWHNFELLTRRTVRDEREAGLAAKIFAESGVVEYGMIEDDSTALGSVAGNVQNGDIFHIFLTDDDGEISGSRSAYFQAARAEYYTQHSLNLAMRVDSEAAEVDSEFRRIEEIIAGIHGRITDAFDVGYGLDIVNVSATDTDIVVDTDVIASRRYVDSEVAGLRSDVNTIVDSDIQALHLRVDGVFDVGYGLRVVNVGNDSDLYVDTDDIASRRYVDSEIAGLIGASPGIYITLTRIREALDSDDITISQLVTALDSERQVLIDLTEDLREDIDSDAAEIRAIGARIDSENVALQADIDSDAVAIAQLRTDLDADIDSDADAIRRLDAEIDSDAIAVRRIDSELQAIRDSLDSEGGAAGSFRSLNDTPNSYSGDAGEFPRVNTAENALEFFDPFPVTNNRLTTLNGLRIRTIGTNFIDFATFSPSNFSVEADPNNDVQWDREIQGFTFRGQNDDLVQEDYLTNVTGYTVNGVARTVGPTYTEYGQQNRTWVDTENFLDSGQWNAPNSVSVVVRGTINDSQGGSREVTANIGWNPAEWSNVTDNWGNQRFDEVITSIDVAATALTDNHAFISDISIGGDTDVSRNDRTWTRTYTGQYFYNTANFSSLVSGIFTKPTTTHSGTEAERSGTVTVNYNVRKGSTYWPTWTSTGTSLGTLSNSGYATPSGGQVFDTTSTNTGAWRNRQYSYTNSTGASVTFYIWAASSVDPSSAFTDPNSLNAVIAGVTRTSVQLGHSGHQVTYYRYAFTVGANSTQVIDVA